MYEYLIYVLRDLPPACLLRCWRSKLSGKYTGTTVSVEASITSLDEFTECPFVFSVGAVEVAFIEAFTEVFVKVNLLPQQLSRNFSWQKFSFTKLSVKAFLRPRTLA